MSLLPKIYKNTARIFILVFVFSFLFPKFSSADNAVWQNPENINVVNIPVNVPDTISDVINAPHQIAPLLSVGPLENPGEIPDFQAKSVLIYDQNSGADLFTKNISAELPIASLTKLMTAIVASESSSFNQPITITKADQVDVDPYLHLRVDDSVLPSDLVKSMLVGSANDAAQTLANHFPDLNNFLQKMNDKAAELGMAETHFSTPIGFDTPGNYSSAADLKTLVNYALDHLPYQEIWQDKTYSFTSEKGYKYSVVNSNNLVFNHPNILSIKTGNTNDAQGCMIVLAKNSSGDKIITLVLDSGQREKDTLSAVDYAFKNFSWDN